MNQPSILSPTLGDSLLDCLISKFCLKFLLLCFKCAKLPTATMNGTRRTAANDIAQRLEAGLGAGLGAGLMPGWTREKLVHHSYSSIQLLPVLPATLINVLRAFICDSVSTHKVCKSKVHACQYIAVLLYIFHSK